MGYAVTLFISVIQNQKRILAKEEVLNQVSYAMEYMIRNIKISLGDATGNCLSNSGDLFNLTHYNASKNIYEGIKFVTNKNICQEIFLDTNGLVKRVDNGLSPQQVLSSNIQINYLGFILNGDNAMQVVSESESRQPRVTVSLNVKVVPNGQDQVMQTTISPDTIND